jgi:hypothetical protein
MEECWRAQLAERPSASDVLMRLSTNNNCTVRGGHHGNALRAAAIKGHKDVMLLQLEKKADEWSVSKCPTSCRITDINFTKKVILSVSSYMYH